MRNLLGFAVATALGFACVSPVQAAVMTVDIYGEVIASHVNNLDVFQVGGTSLLGQDIHVRYVFDTDTPGATTDVNWERVLFIGVGAANSMQATATIGGVTVAIPSTVGTGAGTVIYYNSLPAIDELQYQAEFYDPVENIFAFTTFRYWSETYEILQNHDLTETLDHTIPYPMFSDGYFEITESDIYRTVFEFRGSRIHITSNAPVPEPGVWALMIAGFGLAGSALRRQRRRPA